MSAAPGNNGIDVEQQWDDEDADSIPPPPPKGKRCTCGKWVWISAVFVVAILIIVPLTVTSVNKYKEQRDDLANQVADGLYSPAWSPAMAPALVAGGGGLEGGAPSAMAPAMAAPSIAVAGDEMTEVTTTIPTSIPTVKGPFTCGAATQLVCPVTNSTSNTTDWSQVANDILGEAEGDLSGFQISMSCDGSTVAVGAGQNDGSGDRAGHVRVYRFNVNATAWEQMGSDIDGEAALDWSGHSVSMAADGMRMAVGARFNDGNGGNTTGHVRVFEYDESVSDWSQIGPDIDGEADFDQAGRAVSMSADGTRVAVGASANDGAGEDAGHVRVFELVAGFWIQIAQDIDGEASLDRFGRAVALSGEGDKVVVGAYTNDGGGDEAGHVRVYEHVSGNWTQVGIDIDGTEAGDWAGLTVAISYAGDRIAVGAPGNNDRFVPGLSQVYQFNEVSGNYEQIGQDLKGGYAVSLSEDGNRVAAGDYKGFSGGTNSGHVNVYEYDGSDWVLMGSEIVGEEGDLSGTSVALSADGTRVAVSSPVHADETLGAEVGATRVYDLC